jgi:hypothetical protein
MRGLALVVGLWAGLWGVSVHAQTWPEMKWEALVPSDWDPAPAFKGFDLSRLSDADPQADQLLKKMREVWDAAPTNPKLNGRRIRIAGFPIPLERQGDQVKTFLLVPYFGACIHSPPPPANQIIHAQSATGLKGLKMMQPIWVFGTLKIERNPSDWGVAGYALRVERVQPH